jgi:hypothetical protein
MFNILSEQAGPTKRLNLQLFASEGDLGGDGGGFESTPTFTGDVSTDTTPSGEQGDTETTPTESFVDEDLLSDEIKNSPAYKGMQKAYTQKTQELAEFRTALKEAGMSAKEAANFIKMMNDNPVETMSRLSENLGYKLTKGEQQQLDKAQTDLQKAQDEVDLDPDDEYAQQLLQVAEKRVMKRLEPLLQRTEAAQKEEANKFFGEVKTAIDKVLANYPESGLTKEQLFQAARKYQVMPNDMETALMLAVGREKYLGLVQQKQLKIKANTALENQDSVAPIVDGKPAQAAPQRPKTFGEASKNVFNYFNSLK